ncbi:MAG: serine/threonine-protein kinase [Jaaginema sp. PMC 1079.18]|nr:serine/threonine-protein kinase [Jaaginema sp. PMC 1080.18]MEC4852903.1 serine/threonine-protein kinase [Jaaginema sp. PMC 1079.18]MEC4864607.1 serine/threonine-protein kinase [Jaaginema sp. PMC 1078.18]
MNFAPQNLSSFHNDILQETLLGRLCNKSELFRDRYLILRMIGRGGFGATFLARDIQLPGQPLCAIKLLCPRIGEMNALETARRRFRREAKTLGALGSHSQIPQLLDYFTLGEDFYLVQEYVRGMTLARLVRRYGPQSELVAVRFLREMLVLLQYVHSTGVIHRDVKPQNIIRCQDDNRLVLIDFGAVKEQLVESLGFSSKNLTTHFVGTVGFAPPEQYSLRPVFASDIYALGVTTLYVLTGKAPLEFQGDRSGVLNWQDKVKVSKPLAKILERMLQPSLQERYQLVLPILKAIDSEIFRDSFSNRTQSSAQESVSMSQATLEEPLPRRPSSLAKTAKAIRDWKKRQAQKHKHIDES